MSHHNPVGFTVVIPAYNPGVMLREALESVAAQRVEAEWVVVIDDGSTDGTYDSAIRWIAEFGLPGTVLRQPNQGISVARNAGLAARRTPFVALHDADDVWLPNHLHVLQQAYAKDPSAVVAFGDSKFFGDPRSRTGLLAQAVAMELIESDLGDRVYRLCKGVFDRLLQGLFFPVSAISFRMDIEGQEPRFNTGLAVGEDRYFVLNMARRGPFLFCNEQIARTRRHSGNMTHSDKRIWLHQNGLFLIDKMRLDPVLALTPSESQIIEDASHRIAEALLSASSRQGLKSYLESRQFVSRNGPRTHRPSWRDIARAAAVTFGLLQTNDGVSHR